MILFRKSTLIAFLSVGIVLLFCSTSHAIRTVPLDQQFALKSGESVLVQGSHLMITLKGTGTAHAINDDVIDTVQLIVRKEGVDQIIEMETTNGKPTEKSLGDYKIILTFADGYHQVCSLKVVKS